MSDRNLRFTYPDPVAAAERRPGDAGFWMSHADPMRSVMMQVDTIGAFVRALLPVRLLGGGTVTFGVWLAVAPDDLQRAHEVWDTPAYLELTVDGVLANSVPPWGMLAFPVVAAARERRHTPYCVSSTNPQLAKVIDEPWPDAAVLTAIEQLTS